VKNEYEIRGETTAIFIKRKDGTVLEVLIDTSDLLLTDKYPGTWCVLENPNYYAYGTERFGDKRINFLMHRWLTVTPEGMFVDHINHNTLDNRRQNLRIVTRAQNMQNRKGARSDCVSGVRGVAWIKRRNRWAARLSIDGKVKEIGLFKTIEEAEKAVKEARKRQMPFSKEALLN
jgi:hypothetical protein